MGIIADHLSKAGWSWGVFDGAPESHSPNYLGIKFVGRANFVGVWASLGV